MSKSMIAVIVLGGAFAVSVTAFVTTGTIMGVVQETGVHGSPSEMVFPLTGAITVAVAIAWVVFIVLTLVKIGKQP